MANTKQGKGICLNCHHWHPSFAVFWGDCEVWGSVIEYNTCYMYKRNRSERSKVVRRLLGFKETR